jgi:exopolysaccharide biosynthesis polyprenyl glycosylphosphotransferase
MRSVGKNLLVQAHEAMDEIARANLAATERTADDAAHAISKRIFDIACSLLIFLSALPALALIAVAIKLTSRGPILFRQWRTGLSGKPFTIYKFRTMRASASCDGRQATAGDPRVTHVGIFLRRSSLDELPQILNVMKGDMSVVGPRPHPVWLDSQFAPFIGTYSRRYNARPGITGLAQVNGLRGETNSIEAMKSRVDKDVEYVENWSTRLDLVILLKTVAIVISRRNAQ